MSTTAAAKRIPLEILDRVRVAAPCPMKWEELASIGAEGDSVRHCDRCGLNVYNFANLTRQESLDVLERHARDGQRLCAGLYRRRDGTLISKDCPVGRAAARQSLAATVSRLLGAGLLMVSGTLAYAATQGGAWHPRVRMLQPVRVGAEWLRAKADVLLQRQRGGFLMGAIAMPRLPTNVPQKSQQLYYEDFWSRD